MLDQMFMFPFLQNNNMMMNNNMNMNMNMNNMNNNMFINNMNMNNMNNNMNFQQFGGNGNWTQGYSINNNMNNQIPINNTYNCIFKTSNGKKFTILFNSGKTVADLILTFFKRVDQEDLYEKGGISFIYNTEQLDYHLQTKVENLFKHSGSPIIMVLDVNNLIGA